MKKSWYVLWILLIGLVPFLYYIVGRQLITAAFEDKAPAWVEQIIHIIYPRFVVEKHRFNISFFLARAEGIIIRFCLVQAALLTFTLAYFYKDWFRKRVDSFWNSRVAVKQVHYIRILFYAGLLFFTYDWAYFLQIVSPAAIFYKPVLLLKFFQIGFPAIEVIRALHGLMLIGCLCIIFRVKPLLSSILVTGLFLLLQGWLYSFEKMDHTFSTLTYAALLMPFIIAEQNKAIFVNQPTQSAWPLQLICVCIAMVYGMAGLEKWLIAGTDWIKPQSFRSYLYLHQAPVGLWVAKSDLLCALLPAMAMLFQLSFVVILFYPKLRPVYLLAGVAFHAGNYLLLQVGWYINSWIFVYLFFINWQWIERKRQVVKGNNFNTPFKGLFPVIFLCWYSIPSF